MKQIIASEIEDQKIWEEFLLQKPEINFLSSWNWGVFHQRLGKKVYYRGYYQDKKLLGVSLLIKETAKRGNYFTVAGGPVLNWENNQLRQAWLNDIKKLAENEHCVLVRVRPQLVDSKENRTMFLSMGFTLAPMHLTADLTLQLDLNKSPDTLLSEMRKNTRYEIRKASSMGIVTQISQKISDIDEFYQHQLVLAQKHNFVPFSKDFLKAQFQVFSEANQAFLFHSYFEKQLLATAFVIMYGLEAVYHYGISTANNAKLPGAYACQWAAIQEAQKRGLKRYNFWGITPKDAPSDHRFSGVSLFKRGFGGEEVSYVPAMDLPVSVLYKPVYWFEKIRAKRRHLA